MYYILENNLESSEVQAREILGAEIEGKEEGEVVTILFTRAGITVENI